MTSLPAILRVLVVDDEPLARSRLRTLLGDCKTPASSVVAEAATALQAMDILRRERLDIAQAAGGGVCDGTHRTRCESL